jgi:hypothetical protein
MRRHAIAQLRLAELLFGLCQVTDLRRQVTLRSMTYFERSCPDQHSPLQPTRSLMRVVWSGGRGPNAARGSSGDSLEMSSTDRTRIRVLSSVLCPAEPPGHQSDASTNPHPNHLHSAILLLPNAPRGQTYTGARHRSTPNPPWSDDSGGFPGRVPSVRTRRARNRLTAAAWIQVRCYQRGGLQGPAQDPIET